MKKREKIIDLTIPLACLVSVIFGTLICFVLFKFFWRGPLI